MPVQNRDARPATSDAFVAFVHAYQDMVFSIAARMTGNDTHAQDIAQEVFLKAYDHFAQLRTSPAAGGWLKTVTTRLTLNYLSRYRRRWQLFSELRAEDAAAAEDPAPEFAADDPVQADVESHQRRVLIEQALRELPEHQRLPLFLYHFEELSYEQISRLLRISLPKVKTDIHRARAALAKALGEQL